VLLAPAACEAAQWLGMITRIQEREQKWDARHKDDKVKGEGISDMVANVMKGETPGPEE